MEDILSFIWAEVVNNNLLLARCANADRRRHGEFFAAHNPWREAAVIYTVDDIL